MSIEDHNFSDEYIDNAFNLNGIVRIYNKDAAFIDFNKSDSAVMCKHFKQDRESLVNKIEALIDKQTNLNGYGWIMVSDLKTLINEETEDCNHNFVSADNQVVSGAEICTKCKLVKTKED